MPQDLWVGEDTSMMRGAVVLHEYGGPEKLRFEDNVPEPQISGSAVLSQKGGRADERQSD